MLDHPIVDVALGLILLYTVLSLFASVVKEWISTFLGLRAKNLKKGIQTLIGADYAAKLYDHPLVSTLATEKKLPSYIGSGTFASALVDLLAHGEEDQSTADPEDDRSTDDSEGDAARLIRNVSGDPVLGRALRALSSTGAETVAQLRTEIAAWFDDGMNRVSGWYRMANTVDHLRHRSGCHAVRKREHGPCGGRPLAGRRASLLRRAGGGVDGVHDAEPRLAGGLRRSPRLVPCGMGGRRSVRR